MLSPKVVLIKLITLLIAENMNESSGTHSAELAKEVIENLPKADNSTDLDWGRATYEELRELAYDLFHRKKEDFPHITELLQQIKMICRDDVHLYDALDTSLSELKRESPDGRALISKSLRNTVLFYIKEQKIQTIVKKYSHQIIFNKDGKRTDPIDLCLQMGEDLAPLLRRGDHVDPATMGKIDFNDAEGLTGGFTKAKQAINPEGALKSGWQALGKMLGRTEAFKRGEFVLIGALEHNFKSCFMMCLLCHFILFNKPALRDPTKKPAIMFYSFENELDGNLLFIYQYLYENEFGVQADLSSVTPAEASEYIKNIFLKSGYYVDMRRIDPTEYNCSRLIADMEGKQAEGFEIIAFLCDYLNMIEKTGLATNGPSGDEIRTLFRRVRNYTSPRGITFLTPHQLSPKARELYRSGIPGDDLIRQLTSKGYYDGSSKLGQEPDLELIIHIIDKKILGIGRGKHRYEVTPEEYRYAFLPFKPIGTLPPDINGEPTNIVMSQSGFDNADSGLEDFV